MCDDEYRILERAHRGDAAAHAELYRRHAPMVYTLARSMLGSTSLAEDVVQDCFVDVIRRAGQCHGAAGVRPWIKRIAINRCLSHLRSPWVRRRTAIESDPANTDAPAPEHAVDSTALIERALAALSPKARAVVWLSVVEGYTHEEIGRLMGRSPSYSKSQLARACRRLKEILEPEQTEDENEPCLGLLKIT